MIFQYQFLSIDYPGQEGNLKMVTKLLMKFIFSLNFSKHIGKITKKVGNQLDSLSRLKSTLSISSKMCLYNSYVMSYFTYC